MITMNPVRLRLARYLHRRIKRKALKEYPELIIAFNKGSVAHPAGDPTTNIRMEAESHSMNLSYQEHEIRATEWHHAIFDPSEYREFKYCDPRFLEDLLGWMKYIVSTWP